MVVGQGSANQVASIIAAGQTPVLMTDLSAADLVGIDVLYVQNPSNGNYGAEYVSRLADIDAAVTAGMSLIIHDRYVTPAETILPGGAGFNIIRDFTDGASIDILDNTTLVTNGPGGVLNNASLDGGTSSSHGFAVAGSLPGDSVDILSQTDPTSIVTTCYPFGDGTVVYSTIPLDYYLAGAQPGITGDNFRNIYAPNIVAYAAEGGCAESLTAVLDTTTTNGVLTLNANGSFVYTPNPNFCGTDSFTYHANDGSLDSNIATATITVACVNDAPVAVDNNYSGFEDTQQVGNVIVDDTGEGVDFDVDGDGVTISSNTNVSHGTLVLNTDGSFTYDPNLNYCGPDSFDYVITDDVSTTPPSKQSESATVSITVVCVNDPPTVTSVVLGTQISDYSDDIGTVVITVNDVDNDSTTLAESNEPPISAANLSLTSTGCSLIDTESPAEDGSDCTWTYDGQVLDPGDNVHAILFTASDGDGAGSVTGTHTLTIVPEEATVVLDSGNDVALQVAEDGGDSGLFSMFFTAVETVPDLAHIGSPDYGNLNLMVPFMELVPVGPGGPVPGVCNFIAATNPGDGYAQVAGFECTFDEVPVNTYEVMAWVDGSSDTTRYYTGLDDAVLVIFDPSLGFTTGGGWFYWPGTANSELLACGEDGYAGDKTNFGFNMKYNKKRTNVQGSLLMMRHTVDANCEAAGKFRVKSNALNGLSIGDGADTDGDYGWAAFSGKSVFSEPGLDGSGNNPFLVYVEDHTDEGGNQDPVDEFWIQVSDKDGNVVLETNGPDSDPAGDDAATDGDDVSIENGNIIVPHSNKGGGRR